VKNGRLYTVTLTVILDDMEYELVYGDSISIPCCSKHRAWNKTDKPVRFVEVQTGSYFGEDDIIRLEDDYNRE
jgi:mannose-6-phosphate isomerase